MNIEPFALERWLLKPSKYELAGAGITKLRLSEITPGIDTELVMNYGMTNGSELIRAEIAATYRNVDKDNVLVTSGTAEANLLALYRLLDPGDEFITLNPTYMQQWGLAQSFGAQIKVCQLEEEKAWQLDLDRMQDIITPRTKIVSLVNPNNPTGSVITGSEVKAICEKAERVGAWVLCDGALRGLEFDGKPAPTPPEFYERGIATGSLSKVGMTGPRIGWIITPNKELLNKCWEFKDYTTLCHSGIGEHIATIALQKEKMASYIDRARNRIKEHTAIMADWVSQVSPLIEWVPPKAGHTSFPRYNLDMDSWEMCTRLLEEEGVLVSPGDAFNTPRHFRIRHSAERDVLTEALDRFGAFLRRHSS